MVSNNFTFVINSSRLSLGEEIVGCYALLSWCFLFVFLDGSLFVVTPIDPLFLVLPYFEKLSQKV